MESEEILFDENMEMYTFVERLKSEICVSLSDALYAYEEDLTEKYRSKIANFINKIDSWYDRVVITILDWARGEYNIDAQVDDLELLHIFVLYEQCDSEVYGLEFRTKFDIEHGCGLKMEGDTFEIIEIGSADIAFC